MEPWGVPERSWMGSLGAPLEVVLGGSHERIYVFLAALETIEKTLLLILLSAIGRARGCPGWSLGKRWRAWGAHKAIGEAPRGQGSMRGSFEGL